MQVVYAYLILINSIVFLLMIYDKWQAIKHQSRIPEATLLSLIVIGGSIGGFIGMIIARHKIRNIRFAWGIPLILIIHSILYITIK